MQTETKSVESDFGLSDKEKEDIIGKLEEAATGIQNEVDDIALNIK